jgi:hypothetical protein
MVRDRYTNKQIGSHLSISPNTVKNHVAAILRKLGWPAARTCSPAPGRCPAADRRWPWSRLRGRQIARFELWADYAAQARGGTVRWMCSIDR